MTTFLPVTESQGGVMILSNAYEDLGLTFSLLSVLVVLKTLLEAVLATVGMWLSAVGVGL